MNSKGLFGFCIGIAGFALMHAPAFAQSGQSEKLICNAVGYSPAQPLGDRKGHSIAVSHSSCRIEGGPLDGGVMTGMTIWEWHKGNAVMLSSIGVSRKPGTTLAYQNTRGKMSLMMSDGKVVGVQGSGRGRCTMATGAAAAHKGKAYGFTFKSTGPSQFEIDVTYD